MAKKRICIQRFGYAIVEAATDEEALEKAKELSFDDFDWENDEQGVLEAAEVVDDVDEDEET